MLRHNKIGVVFCECGHQVLFNVWLMTWHGSRYAADVSRYLQRRQWRIVEGAWVEGVCNGTIHNLQTGGVVLSTFLKCGVIDIPVL